MSPVKQPKSEPPTRSEPSTLEQLAVGIKKDIADGLNFVGEAVQCYKAAGRKLIEARDRIKAGEGDTTFEKYLRDLQIGKSRAYELIALAENRTTLARQRKRAREGMARNRKASTKKVSAIKTRTGKSGGSVGNAGNDREAGETGGNVTDETVRNVTDAPVSVTKTEITPLQAAADAYNALTPDECDQFLKLLGLIHAEIEPPRPHHH